MKVLFTQDALVNAGAERSHLEILSRFSKDVDVGFVYFYPKHELQEDYKNAGIRLIFLNIPETYHLQIAVSRLVKLIKTENPDLLISSLWRADIITRIASLWTGVPVIGSLVNDSYSPFAWKDKKGLKYKLVYWIDRLTAGIPKHWIANSQSLVDSHVKTLGLDSKKISVVYRGRGVPDFGWENERVENGELEKGNFRFLSYGRLLERKGFQDAIHAFAIVCQKYPNSSFTIYGEGSYRSQLEVLIVSLGLEEKVRLPGKFSLESNNYKRSKKSEIASSPLGIPLNDDPKSPNHNSLNPLNLLLSSHCFLFPSWYEGFSGALLEAMMSGIPIIASNIPMNLEAVGPNNALIFEVQNRDHLANQMIFAIENPELMADLGQKAREEAKTRFNIEKIAKDYEVVLKNCLRYYTH